jgi:hypothetical protein
LSRTRRKIQAAPADPFLGVTPLEDSQTALFSTPDHMARSLAALVRILKRGPIRGGNELENSVCLFLEKIRVDFTTDTREIAIQTELANSVAVIVAPALNRESGKQRRLRRMELLKAFLPVVHESQLRTLLQLYRSLNGEAREELLKTNA